MASEMEVKVIRRRAGEVRPNQQGTASNASVAATGLTCPDREHCRALIDTMIRGLVDHPESIAVTYAVGERTTVYKVDCDQRCLGQIIGGKGKNISGVRAVIAATMARKGIRAIVEIPYYCIET